MKKWLRRVRGAVGMGLFWAAGWAVAGILIGVASILLPFLPWDVFFQVFDAPLPAMAVPGFVGGALFSVVLGIAGRHRRFDELSVPRFAALGALGGLLICLVPAVMVALGLASTEGSSVSLWRSAAVVTVPFVLLGAISAACSLMLARKAQGRSVRDTPSVGEAATPEFDGQLLGEGDLSLQWDPAARDAQRVRVDRGKGAGDT